MCKTCSTASGIKQGSIDKEVERYIGLSDDRSGCEAMQKNGRLFILATALFPIYQAIYRKIEDKQTGECTEKEAADFVNEGVHRAAHMIEMYKTGEHTLE